MLVNTMHDVLLIIPFHGHVYAYTNSKIVFLARVLLLRIFCILVLRFSSACSCNTRPTSPFALVFFFFYAPCIPMSVAATLHIIQFYLFFCAVFVLVSLVYLRCSLYIYRLWYYNTMSVSPFGVLLILGVCLSRSKIRV